MVKGVIALKLEVVSDFLRRPVSAPAVDELVPLNKSEDATFSALLADCRPAPRSVLLLVMKSTFRPTN